MYVFLSNTFLRFIVNANFQKAGRLHSCPTPARYFALSFCYFLVYYHKPKQKDKAKNYQPLCVSFYYIILLVTTCMSLKIISLSHKNRP